MPIYVPNEPPTITLPYKLAIVGEAPGKDEVSIGSPFVGPSGNLLQNILSQHKIIRSGCLIANVCQVQPPKNAKGQMSPYDKWTLDGHDNVFYLTEGLQRLRADIAGFHPNAILLLGNSPLTAAGISHKVTAFRGSIFKCLDTASPFYDYKCISSLHPAYILRQWPEAVKLDLDVKRALAQAYFPELRLPTRNISVDLTPHEVLCRLATIQPGHTISVDIEGTVEKGITCVGIAESPTEGFVFWPCKFIGSQQSDVARELARVLGDPSISKVLQNSLYDNFVLAWKWKMPIRGVVWDTMLSGWELLPEMEKSLGVQASIYTEEPYYKADRLVKDDRVHSLYCGKDCTVTFEIQKRHQEIMTVSQKKHFEFNMSLLPALLYMEHRGMKYNSELAKSRHVEVCLEMDNYIKKVEEAVFHRLGVKRVVNPNTSSGENALSKLLYQDLRYPAQWKKEAGKKTDKWTANADALLTLVRAEDEDGIIYNLLKWRAFESQRRQLSISADPDGRVRCAYILTGTETGRMACKESPSGSGMNMTTVMARFRDQVRADDGYDFCKCDLTGADGWTVAAWANYFGAPTMLEDYMFDKEFKPAKVLMLMHLNGSLGAKTRPEIFAEMSSLKTKEGWLYPSCKSVQHGSSYGMQPAKISDTIKLRAWKDMGEIIYVEPKTCKGLQDTFMSRYHGIQKWQEHIAKVLLRDRALPCASGHIRTFLDRPFERKVINEALSHEPQANTCYSTKRALHRLWYDPENRRTNGTPIIEPLHQVHDELDVQWPQTVREWARAKMKEYFSNEMTIAHQKITIPFSGHYGPSWGECKESI